LISDRPKHFWETVGGTMTGIAALITAITGALLAQHQLRQSSETNCPPVSTDASVPQSTKRSSSKPANPPKDIPLNSEVVIERQPHLVSLPAQREYTLGEGYIKITYMLLGAKIVPVTPESDALTIRIRLMNRGGGRGAFSSMNFKLLNDGKSITPERSFQKEVPAADFADEDVLFVIPAQLQTVTLRIDNFSYNKEITLDLSGKQD
jgi:hypothetical protein